MNILQVSATDFGGGAAKVAWDLHKAYESLGNGSWMAVGKKKTDDPAVFQIPNDEAQNTWEQINFAAASQSKKFIGVARGAGVITNFFNAAARYQNSFAYLRGRELFDYPGTAKLLQLSPVKPDILHCHNLHSRYFDLRLLPQFSHQVPTVFTLHDTWLLSGHCAYAKTCDRWRIGCGQCPDLSLYPALRCDNTAYNWQRKKEIYEKSKLHIVTPCKWLMNKVQASMLQPGIRLQRVIHNGVDLDFFKPGNKQQARAVLGLDQEEFIVLFVANSIRNNIWKDFSTLRRSAEIFSTKMPRARVRFICFGDDGCIEYAGHIPIVFIPHTDDLKKLVLYYQAADLYLHAAKADTFPTVILEALACGLPVIATAVDGISEQVKSLSEVKKNESFTEPIFSVDASAATGVLVAREDAMAISYWIDFFMRDNLLLRQLSINARAFAFAHFCFKKQTELYLSFYKEVVDEACMGRVFI